MKSLSVLPCYFIVITLKRFKNLKHTVFVSKMEKSERPYVPESIETRIKDPMVSFEDTVHQAVAEKGGTVLVPKTMYWVLRNGPYNNLDSKEELGKLGFTILGEAQTTEYEGKNSYEAILPKGWHTATRTTVTHFIDENGRARATMHYWFLHDCQINVIPHEVNYKRKPSLDDPAFISEHDNFQNVLAQKFGIEPVYHNVMTDELVRKDIFQTLTHYVRGELETCFGQHKAHKLWEVCEGIRKGEIGAETPFVKAEIMKRLKKGSCKRDARQIFDSRLEAFNRKPNELYAMSTLLWNLRQGSSMFNESDQRDTHKRAYDSIAPLLTDSKLTYEQRILRAYQKLLSDGVLKREVLESTLEKLKKESEKGYSPHVSLDFKQITPTGLKVEHRDYFQGNIYLENGFGYLKYISELDRGCQNANNLVVSVDPKKPLEPQLTEMDVLEALIKDTFKTSLIKSDYP